MRLLAYPLSCPLHGLRTSRYREACASAPEQGRSESHRHRKQVLELLSITALAFGTNPPDLIQGRFLVNESHSPPVNGWPVVSTCTRKVRSTSRHSSSADKSTSPRA